MADTLIVTQDSAAASAQARATRPLVFTSASKGYLFYVDVNDDLVYIKTTDGGTSWGSPVVIRSGTVLVFGCWYDRWTPDYPGTKIHITYGDQISGQIRYVNLDTITDTLSTDVVVFATAISAGRSAHISLARMIGGNLFLTYTLAATGTVHDSYKSTDNGATWINLTSAMEGGSVDYALVFPGNESDPNDVWILFYDHSALELSIKVYDDSAGTYAETSIATGLGAANTTDGTGQNNFDAVMRPSNRHLIIAFSNGYNVATSDTLIYDLTAPGSVVQKTNITTNIQSVYYVSVFVDDNTGDWYVGHIGKTDNSESLTVVANIYYEKSINGGTTWVADNSYSQDNVALRRQLWSPCIGNRLMFVWRTASAFGIITNTINTLDLTPPTPPYLERITQWHGVIFGEYPVITVAPSELAGTADLTFYATATPFLTSALIGTSALTTVGTVTAKGTGRLYATTSLVVTGSGTLKGKARLVGQTAQVFTATGALKGVLRAAGSSSLQFLANAATGGTAIIYGTSTLVVAGTGIIKAVGKLSGTASLVLTGVAHPKGGTHLSGVSTLFLSGSGTVRGVGYVKSVTPLVFTAQGQTKGVGSLRGTSQLTVLQAADLNGAGKLRGTTNLQFDGVAQSGGGVRATSTLTIGGVAHIKGYARIAGTISLVFTGTSAVGGLGRVAGVGSVQVIASATLTATRYGTGTANLTLVGSARPGGVGALRGTSSLTFSATAAPKSGGALRGTSTLTFTASALSGGFAPLVGSANLSVIATARPRGSGAIHGTCTLTFTGTGAIKGQAKARGLASLVLQGIATPKGSGVLRGHSDLVISGVGDIAIEGQVEGVASLKFTAVGELIVLPTLGRFQHSPATIIQKLLICKGLGVLPSLNQPNPPPPTNETGSGEGLGIATLDNLPPWPIYVSHEPMSPDDVITIMDSEGTPDGRIMVTGQHQRHYGLRFRIRSRTHTLGYTKARQIALKVQQEIYRERFSMDSSTYDVHWVHRKGSVVARGKETPTSHRRVFTFEATVALKNYGENG